MEHYKFEASLGYLVRQFFKNIILSSPVRKFPRGVSKWILTYAFLEMCNLMRFHKDERLDFEGMDHHGRVSGSECNIEPSFQ